MQTARNLQLEAHLEGQVLTSTAAGNAGTGQGRVCLKCIGGQGVLRNRRISKFISAEIIQIVFHVSKVEFPALGSMQML